MIFTRDSMVHEVAFECTHFTRLIDILPLRSMLIGETLSDHKTCIVVLGQSQMYAVLGD